MKAANGAKHEQFATRSGFLYAAIGSAVGLGNIWRFPFITGENGGGAFVLLYLVFIFTLGVPAMIAMVVIGRRGRQSPINSTHVLAVAERKSPRWKYLGWLTVLAAYMALTFFSVVAGWTLDYMVMSARGAFAGIDAEASAQLFETVQNSPGRMAVWHGFFVLLTIFIVARGIRGGLEAAVKFMMPALFVILVILVIYGAFAADMAGALRFMFEPDFSKLDNPRVYLLALGQAFFSLSVGGGGIIAYGAYMAKEVSIVKSSVIIATADTAAALLAGLAIFSIVLSYNLEAAGGPGLIFVSLPIAFGQMPGGLFFGTLFFVLVFFAALSTSISMLESLVSWFEDKGMSRPLMAAAAGGLAWIIGLASVFSFNIWSEFTPLAFLEAFEGATIFRILDFVTANIAIPISAFLITVFVGWVMSKEATMDELAMGDGPAYRSWRIIMRYVAPAAIAAIFVFNFIQN